MVTTIGVAVPIVAILILLVILLWFKLKRGDNNKASKSDRKVRTSAQPYLQRRGELEAEERGRHEMNAAPSIHELEDTQIHEVPTGEETANVLQGREIFELRGKARRKKRERSSK